MKEKSLLHKPLGTAALLCLAAACSSTPPGPGDDCTPPVLSVTKMGDGAQIVSEPAGIDCGDRCSSSFPCGAKVRLRVMTSPGVVLLGWSGACSGAGLCDLTLDQPTHVTASLGASSHAVTVSRTGGGTGVITSEPGGIMCGAACSASFSKGERVTLSARADQGAVFTGWSGACSGVGACLLTVDGPAQVTARFSRWSPVRVETMSNLYGVWGSAPNDVWIVGDTGTILHYDGRSFTSTASNTALSLYDVRGSGPRDVWAVGASGVILHHDGTSWSRANSGTSSTLYGVWGSGAADAWAVGSNAILRYTGAWGDARGGLMANLRRVFGASPRDLWAVGQSGAMARYTGTWTAIDSGTTNLLSGIWGSGSDDVWAVGANGTVLRYQGSLPWSRVDVGTASDLYGVWSSGPSDTWIAGEGGSMLHGPPWTVVDSGTNRVLGAIWGSGPADVWAVGAVGTVLHLQ